MPSDRQTSWNNAFQGKSSMLESKNLERWFAIIPKRLENDAREFINCMLNAARGMRFNIAQPQMYVNQLQFFFFFFF